MIKKSNRYFYKGNLIFSSHNQIAELIIKNNNKVLDIGCHKGFIGQALRDKKWQGFIAGVDKNNSYRQIIKDKKYNKFLNFDVEQGFNKIKEKFDVIVFADVLEHLNNPLRVLINSKGLLTDDGFFVISLPNVANFFIRLNLLMGNFNYKDYGILDRDHRQFFTYKTARKLINKAKLNIVNTYFAPVPIPLLSNYPLFQKPLLFLYIFAKFLLSIRKEVFAYQFIFVCKKPNKTRK